MIKRQTIAGRDATISFIDSQFNPTDENDATLVKIVFDDGEALFLAAPPSYGSQAENAHVAGWNKHRNHHRLAYGVQAQPPGEVAAWNKHRERQRRPYVPPSRPSRAAPPAAPRPRSKPITPHNAAIQGFARAMRDGSEHKAILKNRFGYTDEQIGTLAKAALGKRKRRPYHDLAGAVLRAKRRLDN
jgi:hypothetical protein